MWYSDPFGTMKVVIGMHFTTRAGSTKTPQCWHKFLLFSFSLFFGIFCRVSSTEIVTFLQKRDVAFPSISHLSSTRENRLDCRRVIMYNLHVSRLCVELESFRFGVKSLPLR